jgi:hypothetical protein
MEAVGIRVCRSPGDLGHEVAAAVQMSAAKGEER